jgi:hypothetical protein
VESCDQPVNVTVVASGTAEYWRRNQHRIRRRRAVFAFAIWDPSVSNLGVGLVDPSLGIQPLPTALSHAETTGLRVRRVASNGRATGVTGDVLDWRRTWRSVALSFQADWLYERSMGTCYLRLPALTGAATNYAANSAARRGPSGPALLMPRAGFGSRDSTAIGSTRVGMNDGEVLSSESAPPPSAFGTPARIWRCTEHLPNPASFNRPRGERLGPGVFLNRAGFRAFSKEVYRREVFYASGCAGVAVLSEAGSDTRRNFYLILIGAGIGLGIALLVQVVIELPQLLRHRGADTSP